MEQQLLFPVILSVMIKKLSVIIPIPEVYRGTSDKL
jgi:hypothetical protein